MKLLTYDVGHRSARRRVLDGDDVLDATALLGAPTPCATCARCWSSRQPRSNGCAGRLGPRQPRRVLALRDVRLRAPILQPPTVRDHIAFEEHATGQWTRESTARAWKSGPPADLLLLQPAAHLRPRRGRAHSRRDASSSTTSASWRRSSPAKAATCSKRTPTAYIAGFTIFNDWSCRDLQFDEIAVRPRPGQGQGLAHLAWPVDRHPRRDGAVLPQRHAARAAARCESTAWCGWMATPGTCTTPSAR